MDYYFLKSQYKNPAEITTNRAATKMYATFAVRYLCVIAGEIVLPKAERIRRFVVFMMPASAS